MSIGSLAFFAYNWLLKVSTPTRVATYAYVNPVVAIFLGVLFASETLSPTMIIAMMVIVASVVVIVTFGNDRKNNKAEIVENTKIKTTLLFENKINDECSNKSSA